MMRGRDNAIGVTDHRQVVERSVNPLRKSCMLNNWDFGHYIEDILTHIVNGEGIYEFFISCNYASHPLEEETVA